MMGWPKGRKRAQQGSDGQPDEAAPQATEAPTDKLLDFIVWAERARLTDGAVVVSVSHPEVAEDRHWDGVFSGFRLMPGAVGARWSDGSTYPPSTA